MTKIKLLKILTSCLIGILPLSGCDDGFEELNKSPDLVESPNLDYMLPTIELTLLDRTYYTNVTYLAQFMYHVSSYGAQFNSYTNTGAGEYHFEYSYSNPLKNIIDLMEHSQVEELINYHCIGRILKAYVFHSVTDTYGDVPYFEAGKGFLEKNFAPTYDPQELIYEDMLNELQDAASTFDAAKQMPTSADIIYGGDIDKWKKFAYSLILRLGLRMEKANPENAKKWINVAISGGLMESNEDNCVVYYEPNTYYATISNGQATTFVFYTTWKLAEPFVTFLRENNDPRIRAYSVLPDGDDTPGKQKGLPPFTLANEIQAPLTEFSVSEPSMFGEYDAPFIHMSFSQVQFMLAELAVKGWITGDAKAYYENGVRAAMKQLAVYGEKGIISDQEIDKYLQENPYAPATPEEALNLINTQYWVETHYNSYPMTKYARCLILTTGCWVLKYIMIPVKRQPIRPKKAGRWSYGINC